MPLQMPPMQMLLQQSALDVQPTPSGVQPPDDGLQNPSTHTPAQQSECARHAPPSATQELRHRRTPDASRMHGSPLQHCSANSHSPPSATHIDMSLQRLTPSPVGVQPTCRSTQQLSEPPWPQISPGSTQPGGFTQRRTPASSTGPHSPEQQS